MNKKIKRNDICYCGSGKKYKNCHEKVNTKKPFTWLIYVGTILIIFWFFMEYSNSSTSESKNILTPLNLESNKVSTNLTPPPPGTPPEGKIWSPEHNHWHSDPNYSKPSLNTLSKRSGTQTLTPQPPGEPPEGKVWSPEHNHWHDK